MTERSDFYVYVLFREDGRPFYVGKGSGSRMMHHDRNARRGRKGKRHSIIRKMLARATEVPAVKLHEGLTEALAFAYEAALITAVGRNPHGPLVNLTDGGEGMSGHQPTSESNAKRSATQRGRKQTPEAHANIAAELRRRNQTPEMCAKTATRNRQREWTPEARAKIGAALTGKTHTQETRAKVAAALATPEVQAKLSAVRTGRKLTPETIAKRQAKRRANWLAGHRPKHSPETRAKLAAAASGKKPSPETRAKISEAQRARFARLAA